MFEHIDEKMTRLELYHRVIDGIATALGYRMGQTYSPEALVEQVKQLVAVKSQKDVEDLEDEQLTLDIEG